MTSLEGGRTVRVLERGQDGAGVGAAWIFTGLAYLILLAPFLCARIPPLVDYPNHLARFWVIASKGGTGAAAQFYGLDWSLAATNVGVDRTVAMLAPLVAPSSVAHTALILAVLLTPVGAAALNGTLFRGPSTWWAMLPIASWPSTLLLGFLNFQIGLGLALAFAAADAIVQRRRPAAAIVLRVGFAAVLIQAHLLDLLFYAALVAAVAFGAERLDLRTWGPVARRLGRAAGAAAWCLAPFGAFLLFAHALPAFGGREGLRFGSFTAKLRALASPVIGYDVLLDLGLALTAGALIVGLARRRGLQVHAGLATAAGAFLALAVLAPDEIGDSSWLDARFALMSLLCLLTGLSLAPRTGAREARTLAFAALALISARTAGVAWGWTQMEPQLAATKHAIAKLPMGARVLPLQHRPTARVRLNASAGRYLFNLGDATFSHYPLLAVPMRQAFVPTMFALRGKQPVEIRPALAACSAPDGGRLPSVNSLGRRPDAKDPAYMSRWRSCFDFILVLNADLPDADGAFVPPPGVTLVADRGFAQLWRISAR
ncbi:MAG TPA: hypothetical protein VJP88_01900 [Caulobacteraceae bacterium]|nr:hypothetical protein [Caulobacteraceae bacterium]